MHSVNHAFDGIYISRPLIEVNGLVALCCSKSGISREKDGIRASDFFQDWWAKVTHGAFSEMMGPSISNYSQLTFG